MASNNTGPRIALYVRAVKGRLVSRYGSAGYFGARRTHITRQQQVAGEPMLVWDTDCVYPVTEATWASYRRELSKALRTGDLVEATEAEHRAWLEVERKREAAHCARLEAEAKAQQQPQAEPEAGKKSGAKGPSNAEVTK